MGPRPRPSGGLGDRDSLDGPTLHTNRNRVGLKDEKSFPRISPNNLSEVRGVVGFRETFAGT